jgi:hypothetical protein
VADALAAGKVVSPASYKLMSTPFKLADGGGANDYGFGLFIDSLDGHARIQHGGNIFGFNSMLARFPDDGVTVAVISNSQPVSATRVANRPQPRALGVPEAVAPWPCALRKRSGPCEGGTRSPRLDWR